jgi:hypothetical protein
MKNLELLKFRRALRTAVADYMGSEGCSCCENTDEHKKHRALLGKLLKVPMYKDRSGYDFSRFQSNTKHCLPE